MASWPLVRNPRSAGSPMTSEATGSAICSRGIHWRAPISACPAPSRTQARCTVLMPLPTAYFFQTCSGRIGNVWNWESTLATGTS